MTTDSLTGLLAATRQAPMVRLLSIAGLTLVLQVPILMIDALITERGIRRDAAVEEVSARWGLTQNIAGPILVVPYLHHRVDTGPKGETVHSEVRQAVLLPARLKVTGTIDADVRRRGIFGVPIYTLKMRLEGEFARPNLAELGIDQAAAQWPRAHVVLGISDVRAISESTVIQLNETSIAFQPGTGGLPEVPTGIRAPLPADAAAGPIRFSLPLVVNGSVGLFLAPFAQETTVELTADSEHPNFTGHWLPVERTVSATGFQARWTIPSLGRNYPQAWVSSKDMQATIAASLFGVELVDPIDEHRMAARSVKYAALFMFLTFGSVWMIEVLASVRIHPIQYLLLGAALCVFYLLELSLAEHLTFVPAYAIASAGIVGLITAYGVAIFGKAFRAAVVGGGIAGLYAYLFVLLTNEDYALLVGAIGLFVILAAIMMLTRNINWYGGQAPAGDAHQA